MGKKAFRIRLPKAVVATTAVAQFKLEKPPEISSMSRRARILGALGGLQPKQRNLLVRSVTETCRVFIETETPATVNFGLSQLEGRSSVEVVVTADPKFSDPISSEEFEKLRSIGCALDRFEVGQHPTSVLLGQLTPNVLNLTEQQTLHWAELLTARSLEDAIAIAQHGRQLSNEELGIARAHGPGDEAREQAASDRDDLETLSLVVSRSPNAILVTDNSGAIQWTNQAFEKLHGYTYAEVVGRRIDELLFGPSTGAAAVRSYQQAMRNGHEMAEDVMVYHRDGRTLWVDCKLIPVHNNDGKVTRWIGIHSDVTQRRQTEDALRAAKQSAEMNSRAKSEFLANMSHEIRTPLNAVVGMTELALTTKLSTEQRDYLNCVQSSADTLLGLLNDVLDVSKIEAGKMEIESVVFNLAELIRETLKALAVKAHEKKLELAVHMPMDIPQFMVGDPTRIRQVLFNLVGNAIKFTDQGEVVVEIEEQWRTNDEVCLHVAVRDTGIGIPKDRLQQIFESFTQVDSTMARRYGGTGLGLTITSELIRMMDGKIWVQSAPNEGSTFHFTIQAKLADAPESAELAIDAEELNGKTALVVDDNATNRRILDEMLQHWGVQPTLTDGAASALRELENMAERNQAFDIVLLDAMMPRVDGFQLAETIKNRPELRCGTVMMLSSADRPNSAARCRHLGIESYLVKPISASALLEAIMSNLSGRLSQQFQKDETPTDGSLDNTVPPAKRLRVLVVDDHEPNRKLAMSILARRGHECVAASDGDEAIAACSQHAFDAVLMDVQMPGRDGFTATRVIRDREKGSDRHLPIIALTAHALTGDREKCLRAGMDAYLAKPIHARELVAIVERVTGAVHPNNLLSERTVSGPSQTFDINAALERMNGETDLLIEHIGFVINDAPVLLASMREALVQGVPKNLEIAAHRLKSLVSAYSHDEARGLAQSLEFMARDGQLEDADETIDRLESELDDFIKAIEKYVEVHA